MLDQFAKVTADLRWLLAQHGRQFLDCDALPNVDCTWCEWIPGCEERRVILITPGSEFGHGWWRIHQVKIELYNFWQDSNTELNHLGHRTRKIIVPKQFLIPIKRESFFYRAVIVPVIFSSCLNDSAIPNFVWDWRAEKKEKHVELIMDERVSFQTVDLQMMTQKIGNVYVLWRKHVIRWIDEFEWNFWNKSVVCHLLNTNCPWTNPALKSHLASSVMSWQSMQ